MTKILITGFKSDNEAEEFIRWFEKIAEQDTEYWFEVVANDEIRDHIHCNMNKTYPIHKNENGEYILDVSDYE